MANMEYFLEAERRGILPPEKAAILNEARRRGLVPLDMGALTEQVPVMDRPPIEQPAQEQAPQEQMNPLLRTLGRAGRNVAAGVGGALDVPLLIPKTAAGIAEFGMEKAGMEGSPFEVFANKIRTTPSVRDTALSVIDNATGGQLKPQGAMEGVTDFAFEMAAPTMAATKLPALVNAVMDPMQAMAPKASFLQPNGKLTSDDIARQANAAYKRAEDLGGYIKGSTTDKFLDDVVQKIMPQTKAGKALAGDSPVSKVMKRLETLRGRPLSLQAAQEIDEYLGDAIDDFTEMGRLKKPGKRLLDIQNALRDVIDNATPDDVFGDKQGFEALKEGRKLWSKSAKLRDVEKIITRAEMSEQPANALKSGFRTLYNNPNRMRGFTKAEKAAVKKAANAGVVSEILRGPASRLFGIGMAVKGGPVGYAAGKGVEMASRSLATKDQLSRAAALESLISGSDIIKPDLLTDAQKAALAAFASMQGAQFNQLEER